ncbi:hypothetical protein E4U21_003582 [Claviceps maximensis]|nr:hypothetical protein E4U21_003582 [Claviceps maximensis]
MKICVVSLADDPKTGFGSRRDLPNPSQYIPRHRHEFIHRKVNKQNVRSEIDALCGEDFDAFMNYMGIHADGIKAAEYLESKNVTILTNPTGLLRTSRLDLRDHVNEEAFRVPRNRKEKYPKMVQFLDKSDSRGLVSDSVCHDDEAVKRQVSFLQKQNPASGILIQDYIYGDDCAAIVMDMCGHLVTLTPLRFIYPETTPSDAEFLTRDDKTAGATARDIAPVIMDGEVGQKLRETAIFAFKAVNSSYDGAFAHVKMRVERHTGDIYVMDVEWNPFIFDGREGQFDGDFMLETIFPGKQEAFLDMLLTVKRREPDANKLRITQTAGYYDSWSDTYDESWRSSGLCKMQDYTVANFDYSGSVLDLGCGPGGLGRLLDAHGVKTTEIVGVEISAGMLCAPDIKKYYKKPLWNCSIQEYVMKNVQFDHVVCFSALLFLDAAEVNTALTRMFIIARKSISIEVENLTDDVIAFMKKDAGPHFHMENHVKMVERFGVPGGWKLVHKQKGAVYPSPASDGNVEGYIARFEKLATL